MYSEYLIIIHGMAHIHIIHHIHIIQHIHMYIHIFILSLLLLFLAGWLPSTLCVRYTYSYLGVGPSCLPLYSSYLLPYPYLRISFLPQCRCGVSARFPFP
jgi:hypothetical protein